MLGTTAASTTIIAAERLSRSVAGAAEPPKWDSVLLVCRQCRKRKHAPVELKPKLIARSLRVQSRDSRPKPRIALTTCLGLCPKGATAVAYAGRGEVPQILAVGSMRELDAAAAALGAVRTHAP